MAIDITNLIDACGGKPSAAARRCNVSRQLMDYWKRAGIPDSVLYDGGKQTPMHKKMSRIIAGGRKSG